MLYRPCDGLNSIPFAISEFRIGATVVTFFPKLSAMSPDPGQGPPWLADSASQPASVESAFLLFPRNSPLQCLADKPLIGDAAPFCEFLQGSKQLLRQAHVNPRILFLELKAGGLEPGQVILGRVYVFSVLRLSLSLIMVYLLPVHVAGTDGPNEGLIAVLPERERNEQPLPSFSRADGSQALFRQGMVGIGVDRRSVAE
jgi:hypothetical protein